MKYLTCCDLITVAPIEIQNEKQAFWNFNTLPTSSLTYKYVNVNHNSLDYVLEIIKSNKKKVLCAKYLITDVIVIMVQEVV